MKSNESTFNRRKFIGALAATGAVVAACSNGSTSGNNVEYDLTTLLDKAPDGEEIKVGVIGCGGRGTGALMDAMFLSLE